MNTDDIYTGIIFLVLAIGCLAAAAGWDEK